jgi:hypothetical protein
LKLVNDQGRVRSLRLWLVKPKPLGQARLTSVSLTEKAKG